MALQRGQIEAIGGQGFGGQGGTIVVDENCLVRIIEGQSVLQDIVHLSLLMRWSGYVIPWNPGCLYPSGSNLYSALNECIAAPGPGS